MIEEIIKKYEHEDYVNLEDNMTTEEIIRTLEYIKRGYIPDYNFTGDEDDIERFEMHTAMNKAINIIQNMHAKEEMEEQ